MKYFEINNCVFKKANIFSMTFDTITLKFMEIQLFNNEFENVSFI